MKLPILSPSERCILFGILRRFSDRLDRVALFGSRATGRARPNSDIDLVVYGDIDRAAENELWRLFDESDLPVTVDIVVYDRLNHADLKAHIDNVALTVWSKLDLLQQTDGIQA